MSNWSSLFEELETWRSAGLRATFWLRDDDAVDACPELHRFLQAVQGIPLAIAPIPARVTDALASMLRRAPNVSIWQHGWEHRNWGGERASEYPESRSVNEVSAELSHGKAILQRLFGGQTKPVFVPPWGAFADEYITILRKLRFAGLSRAAPRRARKINGVSIVNGHVEMIEWSAIPTFADEDFYLSQILDHLRGRRTFQYDYTEATGLIWHHQHQNDKSYEFLHRFIDVIKASAAASWVDPLVSLDIRPRGSFIRVKKRAA